MGRRGRAGWFMTFSETWLPISRGWPEGDASLLRTVKILKAGYEGVCVAYIPSDLAAAGQYCPVTGD